MTTNTESNNTNQDADTPQSDEAGSGSSWLQYIFMIAGFAIGSATGGLIGCIIGGMIGGAIGFGINFLLSPNKKGKK
ncbi:MAG: hypothetical protein LBQ66_16080 [Planctomycetaceae bacterium]|jgi:uncharacterized membrane protein YoaK (UPF0700 family)|nr:hypothetical protein [Planctomycetaceae bacterium]